MGEHTLHFIEHAVAQVAEKASAGAAPPAQKDWPPAMRAYVERVFAAGIPPERKAAVQVGPLCVNESAAALKTLHPSAYDGRRIQS